MCEWFDKQDKVVRIILLIPFWGWLVSGLYRIFKYTKTKNTVSLVLGILCLLPIALVGFIFSVVDLVTTITEDKIKFLCD